ncbi:MAG: HAMP domain-containing protein [Deltaproteobacteria bacterium]|nr:HAMP domain-containing protein [Deltaproteobacteria bacterium]
MWEKFKFLEGLPFRNLGTKLLFSFLLVVLAGGLASTVIGTRMVGDTIMAEAQKKVRHDLDSAWMVYNEKLNRIQDVLHLTAKRDLIIRSLMGGQVEILRREMERVRIDYGFDVLTITDKNGVVLTRARTPYQAGDFQGNDELVRRALKKEIVASTEIIPQEELAKEGPELVRQVYMEFVPTPKAKERPETRETSGMMLKAAVPILDFNNNVLGVMYGGTLLNRNYEIVDKIRDIVFKGERYKGKDKGTATIFQWDLRISTNVKDKSRLRAIGTRIARDVYDQVLENGRAWIDRAFVVNEWYIAAYEPIRNIKGEIIGILYTGTLEEPYTDIRKNVIYSFFGVAFLGLVLVLFLAYFITRSITRPIGELAKATEVIAGGDFSHEVSIQSKDEVGHLAISFNRMIRTLKVTMEELYVVNNKLQDLNRHYLEMVGFITHELNQPMGVLKGFLILLKDEALGPLVNSNQKQAVSTMLRNVNALINMIQKYLQLGRIESGRMEVNKVRMPIFAEALSPILEDEKQQLEARKMEVVIDNEEAFRRAEGEADPVLLRIVFSNLIGNALKYGREGGKIWCGFKDEPEELLFYVKNEGQGIPGDKLTKVFEKFTRLQGELERRRGGTGLGLFNAKEIIDRHGGRIWAESEEGKWANFLFSLPKGGGGE